MNKLKKIFEGHGINVLQIPEDIESLRDTRIIASYFNGFVKVVDTRTGKIIQKWKDPPKTPGQQLLSTSDIIDQGKTALVNWYYYPTKVFDIERGDLICELDTPAKMDKKVAVSPQGTYFVVSSRDYSNKFYFYSSNIC